MHVINIIELLLMWTQLSLVRHKNIKFIINETQILHTCDVYTSVNKNSKTTKFYIFYHTFSIYLFIQNFNTKFAKKTENGL